MFTRLRKIIEQNDLFEDWPYPLIYKDLDRMYPGSKFILTVRRDEYKWLESYKKHSLYVAPLRFCSRYAYGHFYPHGHEEEHLEFYRKFNAEAYAYFKDRPGDFIEICWEKGDGWEKLCGFLGKDIPGTPVPHTNKGSAYQARLKRRLVNYVFSQYCARRKV